VIDESFFMTVKLRFFDRKTGNIMPHGEDYFVRSDNTVWRDNYRTFESQCSVVSFEDFVVECPGVGWELVPISEGI